MCYKLEDPIATGSAKRHTDIWAGASATIKKGKTGYAYMHM